MALNRPIQYIVAGAMGINKEDFSVKVREYFSVPRILARMPYEIKMN